VLIPGKLSPKLIPRALLRRMRPGSAIVDVGIDQGGIAETSRPTSHSRPLFVEEGIVHYCVPNMPSAVARTATLALTQATLPYALKLATLGLREAPARRRRPAAGLADACRQDHPRRPRRRHRTGLHCSRRQPPLNGTKYRKVIRL
jgi:alanine dehydrogenase